MISALFYVWEDARVWAHGNHSLDMHLNYLGPVSCFSSSEFPSGRAIGTSAVADGLMVGDILVY